MQPFERMLLENKAWADEKVQFDPDYFERLVEIQRPEVLWIGCSDSRVPAESIVNGQPGEMFVHRNIANQVLNEDVNGCSVIEYAVEVLEVQHIIVCGHYNCGGIRAALDAPNSELTSVNRWLVNVRSVLESNRDEMESLRTEQAMLNHAVELNVMEQVQHLTENPVIRKKWEQGRKPSLHGWVYGLEDGRIKDLIRMRPSAPR
jgi:carbonic anhydrase